MKTTATNRNKCRIRTITIIISLIIISTVATAQVLPQDSLALVAFYNSTGGPNWNNNTNWLTGPVSSWYGVTVEGNRVTELIINSNNLSGILPDDLGQLTALQSLGMSNDHKLTGEIPVNLFQINTLVWFGIGNCSLTGTIPNNIGNSSLLKSIELWENNLTGSIPPEIGNLDSLKFLDLHDNQLTGQIPPELGNCAYLWELRLNDNQLTGKIPVEVTQLDQLSIFYLYNNLLSGKLPQYLSNLFFHNPPYSVSIDVSENMFEGALPESWGDMTFNIDQLNVSNNLLTSLPAVNYNWLITSFNIRENKLTFEYIEPHYQAYQAGCYYFFYYNPQDSMGVNIDTTLTPGSNYSIYSGTGGEYTSYKWYKNGELILESTDADSLFLENITASDSGIYTCTAENSMLYELTLYRKPIRIYVDTGAGTVSIKNSDNSLTVYPNPANNKVTISLPFVSKPFVLKIYNLKGTPVLTQPLTVGNNNPTVNIEGLIPGIYLLQAKSKQKIYTAKLIINRQGTNR